MSLRTKHDVNCMIESLFHCPFYEITPKLNENLSVFPGDVPFKLHRHKDFAFGDNYTLSSISMSVHAGAHMDTPIHYHPDGKFLANKELLQKLNGPAILIKPQEKHYNEIGQIRPNILETLDKSITNLKRVLFCTYTYNPYAPWNNQFASLSEEVITHLAKLGVELIGIDTPSVDPAHFSQLKSHQQLFAKSIINLECLNFPQLKSGLYELLCIPLDIQGSDALPIRAFLFEKNIF